MPFSNAQARRILHVNGEPFIDPARVPHLGLRLTESYLRRKLYSWEDRAVTDQWRTFDAAYTDIRNYGIRTAENAQLDTLERTYAAVQWKRDVMTYARQRLAQATRHTAESAFKYALTAWYANYYGKAWQLDVSTKPDVLVNVPTPSFIQAHRNVLLPDLQEAAQPDGGLYEAMGEEWRQRYADELAEMLVKVQRGMDRSTNEGHTITQAMRGLRDSIGLAATMDAGFTANFYRMQTLTRTAIMDGAQDGAEALWTANSAEPEQRRNRTGEALLLSLVTWVTARDERVCVTCRGLDGQTNSLLNPLRRRPPAHPNCRCQEVPSVAAIFLMPDDYLPQDTFGEWLAGFGVGMMLDDFLGVGLESTQV